MKQPFDDVVAGRPQLLRAMNEETLLNALRKLGPLMRVELGELSGLSKPTVGLALANLERHGLVRVAGRRTGSRGPAALLYEVDPSAGFVLALDVGSEYVRGAVGDLAGGVRVRGSRNVHATSWKERLDELVQLAGELCASAGVERSSVTQTVVGSPGVHDEERDQLFLAMTGWEDPGVLAGLRREFGPTVVVENDINLAALAERDHGHGREVDTFAFVSIGTGIGMGLVIGGSLHTGERGAAGEIGYLPIGVGSTRRHRGTKGRGSLEVAASAAGIVRAARAAGMRGRLSAKAVFDAAAAGDERAQKVVADESRLVAAALASVVLVADPGLVVLGGGIGSAPGFAAAVQAELHAIVPFGPEVRPSAIGGDVIVDGALVAGLDLGWRRVLGADRGEG